MRLVVPILLVAVLISFGSAKAQETERAKRLGQRLMCICGCNQILTACNHVGCKYSHAMLKELDERIVRGESDDLILQDFVQEYGQTVLAAPPDKGFNRAAWIMPVVVPLISLYLLWEVVRRWRQRAALATATGPKISPELIARAQREADPENHEQP
jgi:cytochrome c-type biogenesis protein CcmH/NrfF